jgi:NADH:ubiquinone oxidoreductase subunit C
MTSSIKFIVKTPRVLPVIQNVFLSKDVSTTRPKILKYNSSFVSFFDSSITELGRFNGNSQFRRIEKLVSSYLPTYFTLLQFSGLNSFILHVKLEHFISVVEFLRYSLWYRATMLIDIIIADFPARANRFEITYCFLSIKYSERVYLKLFVNELTAVPSLSNIFSSANWLEREAWDLYGVMFRNHYDLRRILTDYGFFGHPLRKNFPLTGFSELRYDDATRRVVSEPLSLIQEMRLFSFSSPWK